MTCEFWLKTAGYCTAHEHHALRGGRKAEIRFPATYGVIRHPEAGWILFDTGYTDRFHQATRRLPGSLYAKMTPVTIPAEEEAVAEVRNMGIQPEDIRHIIVSHFHADHTGGLHDFPNATFYCTRAAFEQMNRLNGWRAVRRGILKTQIPEDFAERMVIVDEGAFGTVNDEHLGRMIDLLGDGSILLPYLPGHAAGQIGALLNTTNGPVLLVADAAWLKENYQQYHLPSPIVKLLFDSWSDFTDSLKRVHNYWKAHPETLVIPTHCEETRQEVLRRQSAAS